MFMFISYKKNFRSVFGKKNFNTRKLGLTKTFYILVSIYIVYFQIKVLSRQIKFYSRNFFLFSHIDKKNFTVLQFILYLNDVIIKKKKKNHEKIGTEGIFLILQYPTMYVVIIVSFPHCYNFFKCVEFFVMYSLFLQCFQFFFSLEC